MASTKYLPLLTLLLILLAGCRDELFTPSLKSTVIVSKTSAKWGRFCGLNTTAIGINLPYTGVGSPDLVGFGFVNEYVRKRRRCWAAANYAVHGVVSWLLPSDLTSENFRSAFLEVEPPFEFPRGWPRIEERVDVFTNTRYGCEINIQQIVSRLDFGENFLDGDTLYADELAQVGIRSEPLPRGDQDSFVLRGDRNPPPMNITRLISNLIDDPITKINLLLSPVDPTVLGRNNNRCLAEARVRLRIFRDEGGEG